MARNGRIVVEHEFSALADYVANENGGTSTVEKKERKMNTFILQRIVQYHSKTEKSSHGSLSKKRGRGLYRCWCGWGGSNPNRKFWR